MENQNIENVASSNKNIDEINVFNLEISYDNIKYQLNINRIKEEKIQFIIINKNIDIG